VTQRLVNQAGDLKLHSSTDKV